MTIVVREAQLKDVKGITRLCQQLGYSTSTQEVQEYIQLETDRQRIVYIACQKADSVIGWINVYVANELLVSKQAEIGGLIVDERYRACGIGRQLMQQAKVWAQQQGCSSLQVRSNIIRQQAHSFYERVGFNLDKTQKVFRHRLDDIVKVKSQN